MNTQNVLHVLGGVVIGLLIMTIFFPGGWSMMRNTQTTMMQNQSGAQCGPTGCALNQTGDANPHMMSVGMMGQNMMGGSSAMGSGSTMMNAADIDKAFIEEMVPHHQAAVMMATMLKARTNRPEMKKLADDIITAQTKEIEMMQNWYQAWFKN